MSKLPVSLENEPLIEAIFEVRFGGDPHLSDILPGALFAKLPIKPKVHRLDTSEIPKQIRDNDKGLIFAPLIRLELDRYNISIGDRNIIIGCKLPYPGWNDFRTTILEITKIISEMEIKDSVERYSIKYVNLIEAPSIEEQLNKISILIKLSDFEVTQEHLSLQLHKREEETLHIISVLTGVEVNLYDNKKLFGAIVDVDSIRNVNFPNFATFYKILEQEVKPLRLQNKIKFFGCLTQDTINEMGPVYDKNQ
jgi:uncharacterized protein (TIGR04255 family)